METLRSSSEYLAELNINAEATIGPRLPFALDNIKAIIFDFDRHLIDTDRAFVAWWETGVNTLSTELQIDVEEARSIFGRAQEQFETIFFFHRLDLVQEIVAICALKDKSITVLSQVVHEAADKAFELGLQIRADIMNLLDAAARFAKINDVKLVMMTGGSKNHTVHKLARTGIEIYFDEIFCATPHAFEDDPLCGHIVESALHDSIFEMPHGITKRNCSGFSWTLKKLGVLAHQVFSSGDHPIDDVRNMQLLGGYAAHARYFHHRPHPFITPDFIANSPDDLTALFQTALSKQELSAS